MLKQKLLTAAIALAISGVALADTVYVTNEADSGTGSFRAAVDAASGDASIDTIEFDGALAVTLLTEVPHTLLNGSRERRLPNTTSIAFEYVEGESILLMLNEHGICASSGSACTSGSLEPSHVLRAMDVPFTAAHGSIRFSLSVYNTEEEIDLIIDKMPPIIDRLRKISPFWSQPSDVCMTKA